MDFAYQTAGMDQMAQLRKPDPSKRIRMHYPPHFHGRKARPHAIRTLCKDKLSCPAAI